MVAAETTSRVCFPCAPCHTALRMKLIPMAPLTPQGVTRRPLVVDLASSVTHFIFFPQPTATHNSDTCFKGHFITKIFHPNVSPSNGEICVDALKKDWQSKYGIGHILTVIKCLLINPNPNSSLDEEAGKMVQDNWTAFEKRAKLMTGIHASRVIVASIS